MRELSLTIVVEPVMIEKLKAFYAEVFDAKPTTDTGWYVVFELFGGSFAIMTQRHDSQAPFRPGSANMNVRVPDVDACYAELLARGAAIDEAPSDKPYGVRSFALRDPAGLC